MTALERGLIRLVDDLRVVSAHFALVGGLAVSIRAEPRTTRDIDVAVRVDSDAEAERLLRDLVGRRRGWQVGWAELTRLLHLWAYPDLLTLGQPLDAETEDRFRKVAQRLAKIAAPLAGPNPGLALALKDWLSRRSAR